MRDTTLLLPALRDGSLQLPLIVEKWMNTCRNHLQHKEQEQEVPLSHAFMEKSIPRTGELDEAAKQEMVCDSINLFRISGKSEKPAGARVNRKKTLGTMSFAVRKELLNHVSTCSGDLRMFLKSNPSQRLPQISASHFGGLGRPFH